MTKQRFKSTFKRNRAGSVLNKAIEGKSEPKPRLTKTETASGTYTTKTNRQDGEQLVVSRKEEPRKYGAIDI